MLNPKTRLLDADVSVPAGSVISGAAYRADITVGEIKGWIVPHDAVLTDAKGSLPVPGRRHDRDRVSM